MKENCINIEVQEVRNGFTVRFFSENGPTYLDYTEFFETWTEVIDAMNVWINKQRKEGRMKS